MKARPIQTAWVWYAGLTPLMAGLLFIGPGIEASISRQDPTLQSETRF